MSVKWAIKCMYRVLPCTEYSLFSDKSFFKLNGFRRRKPLKTDPFSTGQSTPLAETDTHRHLTKWLIEAINADGLLQTVFLQCHTTRSYANVCLVLALETPKGMPLCDCSTPVMRELEWLAKTEWQTDRWKQAVIAKEQAFLMRWLSIKSSRQWGK